MGRGLALVVVAAVLALAAGASAPAAPEPRVAIFYYPWYGDPAHDGGWRHWQQGGRRPPGDLASAFYPLRGPYSSSDPAVLAAHLDEIAAAGIGAVVSSWWGRGSPEDALLPAIARAAGARGLEVAVHLEPYPGRTVETVAADLARLRSLGVRDVYVYRAADLPAAEWAALNAGLTGLRLFAQTGLVGRAAAGGFAGVYTYDVLVYSGDKLARLCAQAHRAGLLCAPSVGPGYDARRATGDPRVKPRRTGATYDSMWRAAVAAGADLVTITSYNEWHEGTQIEPARARSGYVDYSGAWGLTGSEAATAYLARTAYWSERFAASTP